MKKQVFLIISFLLCSTALKAQNETILYPFYQDKHLKGLTFIDKTGKIVFTASAKAALKPYQDQGLFPSMVNNFFFPRDLQEKFQ